MDEGVYTVDAMRIQRTNIVGYDFQLHSKLLWRLFFVLVFGYVRVDRIILDDRICRIRRGKGGEGEEVKNRQGNAERHIENENSKIQKEHHDEPKRGHQVSLYAENDENKYEQLELPL